MSNEHYLTGIVVATIPEAYSISRTIRPHTQQVQHISEQCAVIISGMGQKAAKHASEALIKQGADCLVSWGSACGLVPELRAGSLLVPACIKHQHHQQQLTNEDWHTRVMECLKSMSASAANMIHVDEILTTSTEKKQLTDLDVVAADMESFAIGEIARQHEIPFIAVRCIVDSLDCPMPKSAIKSVRPNGSVSKIMLGLHLLIRPHEILSLIKIGQSFKKANKNLELAWQQLNSQHCLTGNE